MEVRLSQINAARNLDARRLANQPAVCGGLPVRRQKRVVTAKAELVQYSGQLWQATSNTDDKLRLLMEENAALRRELAKSQGVEPQEVTFGIEDNLLTNEELASSVPAGESHHESSTAASSSPEDLEAGILWPFKEEDAAWERVPRREPARLGSAGSSGEVQPKDPRSLHIVHISAEFAPAAKVGGLGDVVTGLARACLKRGHQVEVMLPWYQCLPDSSVDDLHHEIDFDCPKGTFRDGSFQMSTLRTSAYSGSIDGVPVLLLRPDWNASNLFQGDRIYGGSYSEIEAYLYFSRASLEFLRVSGRQPHILHIHEWQAAAVAMLYWERYHHEGLSKPRIVFTIHNLDSTGECRQDEFSFTGVPGEVFATVDKALDERTIGHNPERLCLMKGGIIYSNAVTTVSPRYAHEAVNGGAAGWLNSTFAKPDVRGKFQGILNGIDTALWDPATDPLLPTPFDAEHLAGKALCKRYLQMALHMDKVPDRPMVACVTRLVPQKGIHLIRHAVYRTVEQGGQFVLLGSGHADGVFRQMAEGDFKGHPDVRLKIMYSESLAHLIYAGSDIVLIPSMFEPCGLTQLVGMRYGSVPCVRSTGGLADTVKDVEEGDHGNGFTFDGVDESSLNSALDRALQKYKNDPEWWQQLVAKNIGVDSSWQRSAEPYLEIYSQLVS